jgi:hypothetical protein
MALTNSEHNEDIEKVDFDYLAHRFLQIYHPHNFALGKDILQSFLLMKYILFFCFYAAGDDC